MLGKENRMEQNDNQNRNKVSSQPFNAQTTKYPYYGTYLGRLQNPRFGLDGVVWVSDEDTLQITDFSFVPPLFRRPNASLWLGPYVKTLNPQSDEIPSENGIYMRPQIVQNNAPLINVFKKPKIQIAKRPTPEQVASIIVGNKKNSNEQVGSSVPEPGSNPQSQPEPVPKPETGASDEEPDTKPENDAAFSSTVTDEKGNGNVADVTVFTYEKPKETENRHQTTSFGPKASVKFGSVQIQESTLGGSTFHAGSNQWRNGEENTKSNPWVGFQPFKQAPFFEATKNEKEPSTEAGSKTVNHTKVFTGSAEGHSDGQWSKAEPEPEDLGQEEVLRRHFAQRRSKRNIGQNASNGRFLNFIRDVMLIGSNPNEMSTGAEADLQKDASNLKDPNDSDDAMPECTIKGWDNMSEGQRKKRKAEGCEDGPVRTIANEQTILKPNTTNATGNIRKKQPNADSLAKTNGEMTPLHATLKQNVILNLPDGKKLSDYRWLSVFDHGEKKALASVTLPTNRGFNVPKPQVLKGLQPALSKKVNSTAVEIVDMKTIRIKNFFFEGDAPGAWFAVSRSIMPGLGGKLIPIMKDDGTFDCDFLQPYDGTRDVTLKLPGDMDVRDVFNLSVYCVPYSISFAHVYLPYKDLVVPPDTSEIEVPYCILEST